MTPLDTIAKTTRMRAAAIGAIYYALSKYAVDQEQALEMTEAVAKAIASYKRERSRELNQLAGGR